MTSSRTSRAHPLLCHFTNANGFWQIQIKSLSIAEVMTTPWVSLPEDFYLHSKRSLIIYEESSDTTHSAVSSPRLCVYSVPLLLLQKTIKQCPRVIWSYSIIRCALQLFSFWQHFDVVSPMQIRIFSGWWKGRHDVKQDGFFSLFFPFCRDSFSWNYVILLKSLLNFFFFFLKTNCVPVLAKYTLPFNVANHIILPLRKAITFTTLVSNVGITNGYVQNIDFDGV